MEGHLKWNGENEGLEAALQWALPLWGPEAKPMVEAGAGTKPPEIDDFL